MLTPMLLAATTTTEWDTFRDAVVQWGQVAGAIAAILALLGLLFRYLVLKPLDRKILEATKQIQPDANGGQSLSDVNKKVDNLATAVEDLGDRLDRMEQRSLDMYEHIIDLTKAKSRARNKSGDTSTE